MSRVKTSLDHRKIRRLIWLVLTVFVLLVYSLQSVAGSAYYSIVMQAYATVSSPPVILEEGNCSGTSTIYANKTSAKVNVTAPLLDYVDNNTSDVDSSADKGTHSNFTAQKYGPDSINDTLAEENTGGAATNYELDLEVQWTNVDYDETNEYLCVYTGTLGSENLEVGVWNGSGWTTVISVLQSNQWNNVSVSSYLTSSNFTIRFKGTSETGDTTQNSWNIDATLLHLWTTETYNYVLKVVNQVADNWTVNLQVYDSSNIGRLSSLNISLHDSTSSNQIAVSGGSIVKSEGEPYDLPGGLGSTVYISISNLQATTTDISYLYVHLKVRVPNSSTYILYVITFEIT